jgi:aspartyl-tRNA(Asn)/glutamyl-tRNA(Gln) amidotransferase subunit C
MPINQSDIEKIAQLAHLELDEEDVITFSHQISEIIRYFEQLNELDTKNVGLAIGGLTQEAANANMSRPDEVTVSLGQKAALIEAPGAAYGYFRVPKLL